MSLKSKLIILSFIFYSVIPYGYTKPSSKNNQNDIEIQNEVLYYINQYRQQHGLSKLTMDSRIVIQAKQHSQDMANHHIPFGHQGFELRITRLRSQIKNTGGASENVAYNYKSAYEVVKQWLHSPGHKKNIIGNYNLTGVGVVRDKQEKLYYTQIFIQTSKGSGHYATVKRPTCNIPFLSRIKQILFKVHA